MFLSLLLAAASPAAIIGFSQIQVIERVADGKRGMWIADQRGRWYYASFIFPCDRLPAASGISFDTSPGDRLDKNSAVIVDRERCRFASFEKSDPPPKPAYR